MASKGQLTGMQGVFLVAAELSRRGFIVSPTSRSARGADLLVTDQDCRKAWSVQVKTNGKPVNFWLVGEKALTLKSESHVYVFVNLKKHGDADYIVAKSEHVASHTQTFVAKKTGSSWWSFYEKDRPSQEAGWDIFGDPFASPEMSLDNEVTADEIAG